ncbi:MAG: NAD(P)(+) transhydrogenase (Re/Si-specific) subunit beta [Deltaproteobacteria bacterium]|nr:NAD(P)(+) transhydrogenase (Re/Si-specific) subunit beta [Deltaproteobacteria bacterium]
MTLLIEFSYLIAACLFIVGLKYLGLPATARKGNALSALGMLIAIVVTLLDRQVINYTMILAAVGVGSFFGVASAKWIRMTAMPQMVGLQNGFGGAASALVSIAELIRFMTTAETLPLDASSIALLGLLIGGVTFTGSLVAFGKLQGWIQGAPITFRFQQMVNALLVLCFLMGSGYFIFSHSSFPLFLLLIFISFLFGVLFVIPIGGADMPVVISFLNSFSGMAAAVTGFLVLNHALIVSGALVGASGLILTQIMCKAMNRSLTNVLFGAFGGVGGKAVTAQTEFDQTVRTIDAEEAATVLAYAKSVIIVPGYGMAAAQAQHAVQSLVQELEEKGVQVKFAIHPVAGRMPGHMNVLLAEADVPYTQLMDMEDINPEFDKTDVSLVIGANDVVNPAARHDSASPIYGMPILDVDKSKLTIVIKRSMSAGFSGIDNELFYKPNTRMLFGSARDVVLKLVGEIQQL